MLPRGFANKDSRGGRGALSSRYSPRAAIQVGGPEINPHALHGPSMWNGITTADLEMKEGLDELRANNINSIDPRNKNTQTMGTSVAPDYISVLPGEIMMIANGIPNEEGGKEHMFGFSSVNGTMIPPNCYTDEDFEGRLHFAGIAKKAFKYDKDAPGQTGMSTVIRGPSTIFNTGQTTFQFGDVVVMRQYSISPTKRETQLSNHRHDPKAPRDKLVPFLEKMDFNNVARIGQAAVTKFIQAHPHGQDRTNQFAIDQTPAGKTPNSKLDSLDRLFHQRFSTITPAQALVVVATLAQAGIVTLNVSPSGNNQEVLADVATLLSRTIEQLTTDVFSDLRAAAGGDPDKVELWDRLVTLSSLLGITKRPGVPKIPQLVECLGLRRAHGHMTNQATLADYNRYSLSAMVPNNRKSTDETRLILRAIDNLARLEQEATFEAHLIAHRNAIGTAAGAADAGATFELIA